MVMEGHSVTSEMAVTMVERCCADIDVTDYHNLPAFVDELSDPFLQHEVEIHFERKTSIGSFVWTINVDQYEQTKVYDQGTTFRIQGSEITGDRPLLVQH